MRNYIILNGKRSDQIQGLLISSLPPITKPAIRTNIEEIDGRDGDEVTTLGYAAYDKEFEIGLYGNYDVDEVIQYFDSEGIVTFSNEEEKYYKYQIINQIDFEKLIRFKTATVTMHVQPFKYSTIEGVKTFNITDSDLLTMQDYSITKNGITLAVNDGVISITGTPTAATEFYIPINEVSLQPGSYSLNAYSSGTNVNNAALRLINDSPSAANSFGGTYVTLTDTDAATISDTLTATKTFNYLWFYITAGAELDITTNIQLIQNDKTNAISIRNNGNIYSKPTITLYGTGTINLSLNNNQIFVIDFGSDNQITIDAAAMEAYDAVTQVLKNRQVTGDYNNLALNIGANTISWTGTLTKIEIENYSRWI